MGRYRPSLLEPGRPDRSATLVSTPGGDQFDVVDPALATELGHGARAIKLDRGVFDVMPISLITTRTIASLGALLDAELQVQRFRPNLLVEATGDASFPEDAWVGSILSVGEMRIRVDQRDERCVMVNADPTTAERDPSILRAIARERQACLGVYGQTTLPGRVAIGDPVLIDDEPPE